MKDLIVSLQNILKSLKNKFEYTKEISLLINSISKNPYFIGGSKNLDSNLIHITKGEIFCKGGAEGVFLFAHIKKGICGVFKVIDGNQWPGSKDPSNYYDDHHLVATGAESYSGWLAEKLIRLSAEPSE